MQWALAESFYPISGRYFLLIPSEKNIGKLDVKIWTLKEMVPSAPQEYTGKYGKIQPLKVAIAAGLFI